MVEGKKSINLLRGLLYLSPAIILLGIFTFYPIFNTFAMAFKENYNYLTGDYDRLGIGNFKMIFDQENNIEFIRSLVNTIIIAFVSVPISIILSLLIAVALNSIKRLQKFYQTVFFLPYVTNTIAIGMVFSIMFESHQGLVNTILNDIGTNSVNWLGGNNNAIRLGEGWLSSSNKIFNPKWLTSIVVLMVYIIWNSLPFKVIILLSSLQSIDKQYYQAAQIDETSKFRTLMRITVPLLSPQIFYLLITSFIGAFKEYTSIIAIFGDDAGPTGGAGVLSTMVYYIYQFMMKAGNATQMGQAAAGAIILFILIMIFTAINNWVGKKRVHY